MIARRSGAGRPWFRPSLEVLEDHVLPSSNPVADQLVALGLPPDFAASAVASGQSGQILAHGGEILQLEALKLPPAFAVSAATSGQAGAILAHAGEIQQLEALGFDPGAAVSAATSGQAGP